MAFVLLNNSVATKKGKRDGTTELAHNVIPDFAAIKLEFENIISEKINNIKNMTNKLSFIENITYLKLLFFIIKYILQIKANYDIFL